MDITAPVTGDSDGMTVSQLFDQIATEKNKKREALEKFVEKFTEKDITSFN